MLGFPKKLQVKLENRTAKNTLRQLSIPEGLTDFSSNDYLGFSTQESISQHAEQILKAYDYRNGASGSRLLNGNHAIHQSLEDDLSGYYGTAKALLFNSGYDANLGFFSSVPQRGDVVLYDELVHASIRDGIKLGNANAFKFDHNNLASLETQLSHCRGKYPEATYYVVTESVFSMDGDSPNLVELVAFCKKHALYLIVDEAHAVGVFGKGVVSQCGLEQQVFAILVTFGKAMGCHGAAILGSERLILYLINFSRSLIYTTAMSPHNVALVKASYLYLDGTDGKVAIHTLKQHIGHFRETIADLQLQALFLESHSSIQIALLKDNKAAKRLSEGLKLKGFDVRAILSPTVKEGNERLRICLHAFNTTEEITELLQTIKMIYGKRPSYLREL